MSAAKVRQNEEMDNIRVQFVSLYVEKHNSLECLCTGHSQDVYPKSENDVPTFFIKNIGEILEISRKLFIFAVSINDRLIR